MLCRRGHFGPLKTPQFNIMGDINDTALMIDYVKSLYPKSSFIGAIGISAGSGQVVSFLGNQESYGHPIQAAVSLCPGYNLRHAFQFWHEDHPQLCKHVLNSLKSLFIHQNHKLFAEHPNYQDVLESKTVHEFIVHSATLNGFDSFDHYLEECNPTEHYSKNSIPCLILNARDDPVCLEKNITLDLASKSKNYALVLTKYGSHIAFREGLIGNHSYMFQLSLDFLESSKQILSE